MRAMFYKRFYGFFPLLIDILCNLPLLNVAADDLNVIFQQFRPPMIRLVVHLDCLLRSVGCQELTFFHRVRNTRYVHGSFLTFIAKLVSQCSEQKIILSSP